MRTRLLSRSLSSGCVASSQDDNHEFCPPTKEEEKDCRQLDNFQSSEVRDRSQNQCPESSFPVGGVLLAGQEVDFAMGHSAIDFDGCWSVQMDCRFLGLFWYNLMHHQIQR